MATEDVDQNTSIEQTTIADRTTDVFMAVLTAQICGGILLYISTLVGIGFTVIMAMVVTLAITYITVNTIFKQVDEMIDEQL